MASPRPETTVRPDTSDEPPKAAQLTPVQVAASALAAVSSAVVASFFGVAGTLIGAALASVIATVSTTFYSESLRKTNEGIKRVLVTRQAGAAPPPGEEPADPAATRALPAVARTRSTARSLPAHLDPRRDPATRRGPRWSRVAVYAVAVFAVAMCLVTGIELIGHKPVSALVGTSHSTGTTTLGELADVSSHRDTTPSSPSAPATTAPASTTAGSAPSAPTPTGGTDAPSPSASTAGPTAPTPSATPSGRSASPSAKTASPSAATPTGTSSAPTQGPAPLQGSAPTP